MDLQLAGRAFFVTGGSRGIGRGIVELLLTEGALVATCARDAARLERVRSSLPRDQRGRLLVQSADVRDAVAVSHAVDLAEQRFGRLDGVVANAGAGAFGSALDTPESTWNDQFEVKVGSVLNLVRPALKFLTQSDAARILVINGITAHAPEADMAAVSATRAAVASLTRSLALELAPSGVLVNAISLGAIVTDRQRDRYSAAETSQTYAEWCDAEALRRGVPLGRLGDAHEVAPAAALLLSPLASYVTGSSLDISGGAGGRT
ncbi:SDR family oxidoreductase [Phaeacidiphilus oryzae]|uniref:SDR family oxidoreductase n=1 Tax=Phaeacidiphilus oryzae TaxID=348818 RepID=UPI00055B8F4B|nr:SDR family oxidoreductase [Phaeacidiphilus oryzae]